MPEILELPYSRENRTKLLLAQTVYQLMQETPIDELPTRAIIQQAQVGVTTFYRNFADKYALVNWVHQQLLSETLFRVFDDWEYDRAARATWEVFRRHKRFYRNALTSRDANSLRNYIQQVSLEMYARILAQHGRTVTPQEQTALELYVYGATEINVKWVQGGCKEDAAQLLAVLKSCLPAFVRPYL